MPTETDYAALDDRELDALVAERLFDYEIECLHREIEHLDGSLMMCKECGERFGQTTLAMARSRWPAYHADIKDAWKVVEAMRVRGCHLSMNSYGGLP